MLEVVGSRSVESSVQSSFQEGTWNMTNANSDILQMWFSRWARRGERVGCLQRQVPPHPRACGGAALQGVDLSQPEEAVVGEGCRGQEPQDEGLPGLHALRHSGDAEPCQRPDAPPGALLRAAVSGRPAFGLSPRGTDEVCRCCCVGEERAQCEVMRD